jgi:hypothetical protein
MFPVAKRQNDEKLSSTRMTSQQWKSDLEYKKEIEKNITVRPLSRKMLSKSLLVLFSSIPSQIPTAANTLSRTRAKTGDNGLGSSYRMGLFFFRAWAVNFFL